nr:DUF3592 domain-containing protein [uncultured Devosia sp.]
MDEELKWLLLLIVLAFDGLFLAAVISKYFEVKRASFWAAVPGKIVSSRSEARRVEKISAGSARTRIRDTELRNFAVVKYVFQADGRRQVGQRISLAEDVGNFQVAEKLKRYPVGAAVTVYYDRNRPTQSVLERDMPMRGFEIAILCGILIGLGCLFLLLISDNVMAALGRMAPDSPQAWGAAFCAVLAAAMAAFGYGLRQKGAESRKWPSTKGVVLASDVVQVQVGRQYRWWLLNRKLIRDRTTYSYAVGGVTYRSDRVRLGGQAYASFSALARRAALRFEPGVPVDVYYNPLSPTEAVLVRGAQGQWMVSVAAAAMLALAARLAGLL